MRKRQIKKRTKKQKRNAEVQAAINSAIKAAQASYLNCTSVMTEDYVESSAKLEHIRKEQTQHYKDILKGFADAKDAQKEVIDHILNKQEDHYKVNWKNMLDVINRANQREKELNYVIFGYVILTIATIIIMLTH